MTRLMELLTCLRCQHTWLPRVENPVRCPSCNSPIWSKPRKAKQEAVA